MLDFPYGGYTGKILRVDLTERTFRQESLRPELAEKYLGGRGIGARLLYEEVGPGVQPLDPENKIIITNGPLTGTGMPGSSRYVISTKSPLTGIYLNSVAGGDFGDQMKAAGYDVIIIQGKAKSPVYLWITDERLEIKEADKLWGLDTQRTQEYLKERHLKAGMSIACIGPAGENQVLMASVMNEQRAAGRGGIGAIFGAKNLKAIAAYGSSTPRLIDPAGFTAILAKLKQAYEKPPTIGALTGYGSSSAIHNITRVGGLPTRNWQTGVFEEAEDLFPEKWIPKYRLDRHGCPHCPVKCHHITTVREGPYAGASTEGPEYETLYSFGSVVGNSRADAVIALDELCDRLGLDTIEAGLTIALAMEAYQRGIISKNQTDGLELTWGSHEILLPLVKDIAYKQGFGAWLADGVKKLSQRLGPETESFAMQVKGLGMGGYDPRAVKGMGIGMAHSARGGCHHNSTYTIYEETEYPGADPLAYEGKAELVKSLLEARMCVDLSPFCMFHWAILRSFEFPPKLIAAVTGMEFPKERLIETGERVHNLERAYNARLGLRRRGDVLPKRLLKEPMPEGPAKGETWDMDRLIDEFYYVCGWDMESGIPKKETLERLGLADIARDLWG